MDSRVAFMGRQGPLVADGGRVSYGTDGKDLFRHAASLRRSCLPRREAANLSVQAAGKVRVRRQPEDRPHPRPQRAADSAKERRECHHRNERLVLTAATRQWTGPNLTYARTLMRDSATIGGGVKCELFDASPRSDHAGEPAIARFPVGV
jgi:hypothetical protein